jgi:Tfp pilus assembly protein PilV
MQQEGCPLIKIIMNEKGLTILECILAVFMTTVTIISLVSMQSLSWTNAGKSDYMGRAQGLMQAELETRECEIMTGATTSLSTTSCRSKDGKVVTCGGSGVTFSVTTSIADNSANVTNTYLLRTNVKWPGSKNGIKSSMLVARQLQF